MAWRKEVRETFKSLDTQPNEWKPCEMVYDGDAAYMAMGCASDWHFVSWIIPEGYTMAETKHSDDEHIKEELAERLKLENGETDWERVRLVYNNITKHECCHLCGHRPIKWLCYIQHDEKKLYMQVGTSCVENFDIPGIIKKKKKQYIAKAAMEEFLPLRAKLLHIRAKFLKKKKWMPRWLWDVEKHAYDRDTTRKKLNFIRKYKVLLEEAAMEQTYQFYIRGY